MARSVSRRAFVRLAAAGAAGAVIAPAAVASAAANRKLRVGLLVPTESSYARLGDSFVDGFGMYLEQAGVQGALLTRPAVQGYGGAYRGTQELLELGVDVLVAGVTLPGAHYVAKLTAAKGVPLVIANVGGHLVAAADRLPSVVHHSLLYWQSSFALGRY